MGCETCGNHDVGEIGFSSVAGGVKFHYCRHCEQTWWLADTSQVELEAVLQAATSLARA